MMPTTSWKRSARRLLRRFGYDITRVHESIGWDAFEDMRSLVRHDAPLVFDVGANVGQSVRRFRLFFPNAEIHSFEPSPTTFQALKKNASGTSGVHVWNCALASQSGELKLLENTLSEWTSFLPLSNFGWGEVAKETPVVVRTIDEFCREQNVTSIDILKSDTQGYELEVFKGAERLFQAGGVGFVFCEMVFSDMYKQMPSFTQVYDFLIQRDFLLVSFYDIAHEKAVASWTDGLFVHKSRLASLNS